MRNRRATLVFVLLAAAAVGGMVAVEARTPERDAASLQPGGSDVPVLVGTAPAAAGHSLMRPDPGSPIRIVPVLDSSVKATTPLLDGRDCLAAPATCHNGKDGINLVYAAAADIPAAPTRATVLSDSGCEPDAAGASHCLNRLRTAAGVIINVRNDHRLANEPCLAPGEHVVLAPGASAAADVAGLRALAADRGGSWPSAAGMVTGACTVSDAGLKRAGITRAQLGCSRPAS